ncbi:MAG: radical SAM protein [Candidatus Izimaplasma sp.]|nr:radical SAM protein [Candidatus Izimaplasma bacterium]
MHYKNYKGILNKYGMNLFRGCLHGCIYCDSRSDCYQMDHDFFDVEIKQNAPILLEDSLKRKRKKGMIGTGAMSDPYMNHPFTLDITRKCFEIISKYNFGLTFQTKSTLFLRDLSLLKEINKKTKVVVQMTLTTFDDDLSKVVEPNVETTRERLIALKRLKEEGIPSVVWLSPLLPYINDDLANLKAILNGCYEASVKGIIWFGAGLTLRKGNREYYYRELDKHFPGLKEKYIKKYGLNYEVMSPNHNFLNKYFHNFCSEKLIMHNNKQIFAYLNEFEEKKPFEQMQLF